MKNELGIEVKCKSCQHRIGCWRYNYKYEKLEPCDNFYPDDENMVNRIKELQEQLEISENAYHKTLDAYHDVAEKLEELKVRSRK